MKLDTQTFNRLSLGIIEKEGCSPEEAVMKLESLRLNLVCSDAIRTSLPLQGAFLTAINTGKRAFLGGVFVRMTEEVRCLLPWPGDKSLNDIAVELGATLTEQVSNNDFSLTFGFPGSIDNNQAQVVCNNWQAGILVNNEPAPFDMTGCIPTAGIFIGGLAVSLAFLKMSGINLSSADRSVGISLWRPDLHWLDDEAKGPQPLYLPGKYWILGLGHLGQSYLWNIGLLPYPEPKDVSLLLQDTDRIEAANYSSGLLSERCHTNLYKTRSCSLWLEARGFSTLITERKFDADTKRNGEEPFVALCGFDSAKSRLPLESTGFDLVVETGLGSNMSTFDIIALHTFPGAAKTPVEVWGDDDEQEMEMNPSIYNVLKELDDEICGIIPMAISGKSLSASFVGACSGALVVAELIRGLHGGMRYDKVVIQLRKMQNRVNIINKTPLYTTEHSKNGFICL